MPRTAPAARPVDPVRDRFVYDDTALEIGGRAVVANKDNLRVVPMSDAEARFYIDQGAIGDKPYDRLSKKAHAIVDQTTGLGDPPPTTKGRKPS